MITTIKENLITNQNLQKANYLEKMCGITGVINFKGKPINREVLSRMTNSIAHRGPDGEGQYCNGAIGFGHRRLSIIDLSPSGKQPMSSVDGEIWITYNGEIYNFRDIKAELILKGYKFKTETDTEVIINAYQEWGVDCLEKFNGMFAFAIWDNKNKRIFIARDRIGIKPLFYYLSDDVLIFGSEIKAILPSIPNNKQIDSEALSYYLALNYMPAPFTLFEGIQQLMPGYYILADLKGTASIQRYWQLMYQEDNYQKESDYVEEFEYLIEDAIKIRLMSDVPFGAFLSGGIDSSTISYWMAKNLDDKLKTFSIGFKEDTFSELDYAKTVADLLGTKLHSRNVDANMAEVLFKLVRHAEEPTADSSMVAIYYLSQLAREHVTMALSGDGADEIFAGYETYQAYYAHRLFRKIPGFVREGMISPLINMFPVSEKKVGFDFKLRRFLNGAKFNSEDAHAMWRMIFDVDGRKRILSTNIHQTDVMDLYRQVFAQTNARNPLNRMLYVDTTFYLPNDMLVKVDRMSMAHGLEVRVPFLDHRIVEFAARVPPNLKLRHYLNKKYLVKTAMKGKLPDDILTRKKAGFNIPKGRWIREGLKPFVTDQLSRQQIDRMGFLNAKEVETLLDDHYNFKSDNSFQIWNLLTLSLWWQQFMQSK